MKKIILKKKLIQIFKKHNLVNSHSKLCANALINAELVGAHSHGLSRLKMYCDRIKKDLINPTPKIKIKMFSQCVAHLDADDSIGFVSADIAIKKAISIAKKNGIGVVGVKNSGHYGLSSYYIEQATKKNLIALCFTNAPPAIAPYGARKSMFGTNPIAFGTPSGLKAPFIFDSSMSKINRGKIRVAYKLNKKIPYGVAIDKSGKPTNDPKKALDGVQLPISDFKGSGLAWMVDILSGVLTGSAHSGRVKDPFDDFSGPQNVGHFFIVLKHNIFIKDYIKKIRQNIESVKKLPRVKGIREILYPGQRKFEEYKKNNKKNLKITQKVKLDLEKLLNE